MNYFRSGFMACLPVVLVSPWVLRGPAYAEIPTQLEPDYAEAVLAYNARDYAKALTLINSLLKKAPEVSEILELKALSLKSNKDDKEAAATYSSLIEAKAREGKPEAESAPYHFELGLIRYREKNGLDAKRHFESALKQGFNPGPSNLYLGMFAFSGGNWSDSDQYFNGVISSGADELKPAAHFYLAQTHLKTGHAGGATQAFIAARRSSRGVIDDSSANPEARKIAAQILEATEKALAPFDRAQFFGYVGLLSGYDSNLLAVPASGDDQLTSGKSSAQGTALFSAGYSTSPLSRFQLVPSYRGSFNYNFNGDAKESEFFNHVVSLYVTANPLAPFSYGVKAEGGLTLRNSEGTFRPFTYYGSFGPYVRYQLQPKLVLGLDYSGGPQVYTNEPSDQNLHRSGTSDNLRLSAQYDQGNRFWNPMGGLRLVSTSTDGSEFRNDAYGIDFANIMHLGDRTDLTASLDLAAITYGDRPAGKRSDRNITAGLTVSHRLANPKWTVLGNIRQTSNKSTEAATFSYDRFVFSSGLTYTF